MKFYRITPKHYGYKLEAPCFFIESAKKEEEIEKMAREKSGLGRFPEWRFLIKEERR